jgi:RNA polymerase sigma-70 factor, ECF subfamily
MSAAAVHAVCSGWKQSESAPLLAIAKKKNQSAVEANQAKKEVQDSSTRHGEEQQLVRRAITGDSEAQDALFGRHRSRLYRLALRLLRSKEDAEDAVQDALLSAYRNISTFEGRSLFSTWLTRIVVNAALVRMRRQRARPELFLQEVSGEDLGPMTNMLVDSRPDPEQLCASRETREMVHCALDELSPSIRSAFELRELQDLSNSEAAEAVGIRVGAFKSRISRARGQLAERFSPAAIAPLQKPFCSPLPPAPRISDESAHLYAS